MSSKEEMMEDLSDYQKLRAEKERKLTDTIIKCHQDGMTDGEISQRCGISKRSVRARRMKLGLSFNTEDTARSLSLSFKDAKVVGSVSSYCPNPWPFKKS